MTAQSVISRSAIEAVMKELYKGQKLEELAYDKFARPFFSMLKKAKAGGKYTPYPVRFGNTQGLGATFSTAQGNVSTTRTAAFDVSTVKSYAVAKIETEALLSARGNDMAFINGVRYPIDDAINSLSNDIETHLFQDGSGAIGQVSTDATGTTLTLKSSKDVNNFEVDMELKFGTSKTGALKSGSVTVTAIDRSAGTMTVDALTAIDGTSGVAEDDYIFREGDYVSASDRLKVRGLEGWVPASAPTAGDSFYNVDRSVDATRLAGVRYDASGLSFEEALINASAQVCDIGSGRPNVALMSNPTWRQLVNELGSKVQRDAGGLGKAGFRTLEVEGNRGPIECVASPKCPNGVIWLLELDSWELISLDAPIRIIDDDGLKVRAVYNADQFETRVGTYSNLACKRPSHNCRVTIDDAS